MTVTWKTYEETFHGSKWGYVVVALVIVIVLSLLGSIFYLLGQGVKKGFGADPATIVFYGGVGVGIFALGLLVVVKLGIVAAATVAGGLAIIQKFLGLFWTLFTNLYILLVVIALSAVLIFALFTVVQSQIQISLESPLVIAVLVLLLVMFFPLAIFLIDQFSYEHE
ncbi:MAG: hypothetical protein V1813_00280 [Candidatus Aenigmatarchaeota archaeon]